MKVEFLKDILNAKSYIYNCNFIENVIVGDIYSQVLKCQKAIDIWFTQKNHLNAIAVAFKKGIRNIVFCDYEYIDDTTIEKAKEHNINLFFTKFNLYDSLEIFLLNKNKEFI